MGNSNVEYNIHCKCDNCKYLRTAKTNYGTVIVSCIKNQFWPISLIDLGGEFMVDNSDEMNDLCNIIEDSSYCEDFCKIEKEKENE